MRKPNPASFQKRSEIIAEELKRHIVINNLSAGDRLPQEKELIDLFQSSRGTVREALKSLEVQGLIEIVPGPKGGARLSPVPYERASQLLTNYFHFKHLTGNQIYEVRTVLEPMVAAEAVGRLSQADLRSMEETIQTSRRVLDGVYDRMIILAAELEFHNIIARVCPNPLLGFNCLFINDLLVHFLSHAPGFEGYREVHLKNLDYHLRLVEAFRNQDQDRTTDLMRQHIIDVAASMREHERAIEQGLVRRNPDILWDWNGSPGPGQAE